MMMMMIIFFIILPNIQLTPQELSAGRKNVTGAPGAGKSYSSYHEHDSWEDAVSYF